MSKTLSSSKICQSVVRASECDEKYVPQVEEWNSNLGVAIEYLKKQVEQLLQKISPVTRDETPEKCIEGANEESSVVPLAASFRQYCRTINGLADRVADATNRVEL